MLRVFVLSPRQQIAGDLFERGSPSDRQDVGDGEVLVAAARRAGSISANGGPEQSGCDKRARTGSVRRHPQEIRSPRAPVAAPLDNERRLEPDPRLLLPDRHRPRPLPIYPASTVPTALLPLPVACFAPTRRRSLRFPPVLPCPDLSGMSRKGVQREGVDPPSSCSTGGIRDFGRRRVGAGVPLGADPRTGHVGGNSPDGTVLISAVETRQRDAPGRRGVGALSVARR